MFFSFPEIFTNHNTKWIKCKLNTDFQVVSIYVCLQLQSGKSIYGQSCSTFFLKKRKRFHSNIWYMTISFVIILVFVLREDSRFHSKHRLGLCWATDVLLSSPAAANMLCGLKALRKCHRLNWSILLDQMHWSRTTAFLVYTSRHIVTPIRQTGVDASNLFDPWPPSNTGPVFGSVVMACACSPSICSVSKFSLCKQFMHNTVHHSQFRLMCKPLNNHERERRE